MSLRCLWVAALAVVAGVAQHGPDGTRYVSRTGRTSTPAPNGFRTRPGAGCCKAAVQLGWP
jgi:hypothetical protein